MEEIPYNELDSHCDKLEIENYKNDQDQYINDCEEVVWTNNEGNTNDGQSEMNEENYATANLYEAIEHATEYAKYNEIQNLEEQLLEANIKSTEEQCITLERYKNSNHRFNLTLAMALEEAEHKFDLLVKTVTDCKNVITALTSYNQNISLYLEKLKSSDLNHYAYDLSAKDKERIAIINEYQTQNVFLKEEIAASNSVIQTQREKKLDNNINNINLVEMYEEKRIRNAKLNDEIKKMQEHLKDIEKRNTENTTKREEQNVISNAANLRLENLKLTHKKEIEQKQVNNALKQQRVESLKEAVKKKRLYAKKVLQQQVNSQNPEIFDELKDLKEKVEEVDTKIFNKHLKVGSITTINQIQLVDKVKELEEFTSNLLKSRNKNDNLIKENGNINHRFIELSQLGQALDMEMKQIDNAYNSTENTGNLIDHKIIEMKESLKVLNLDLIKLDMELQEKHAKLLKNQQHYDELLSTKTVEFEDLSEEQAGHLVTLENRIENMLHSYDDIQETFKTRNQILKGLQQEVETKEVDLNETEAKNHEKSVNLLELRTQLETLRKHYLQLKAQFTDSELLKAMKLNLSRTAKSILKPDLNLTVPKTKRGREGTNHKKEKSTASNDVMSITLNSSSSSQE